MAFNQVAKFIQGYVVTVGNSGGIIAGVNQLLVPNSTNLAGACVDPNGNIYVTDASKHIILKITQGGTISTIGGLSGTSGNNGSSTVSAADSRFNYPTGIICDRNGDLYVADTNNHQIRKISNNKVSLVAGASIPASGTSDGVGTAARFNKPYDVALDPSGVLYVADTNNHAIRKIVGGTVSTIAGAKGTYGHAPVWSQMTTAAGVLGTTARFAYPQAIAVDPNGFVYVSDTDNHVIKRIDPGGRVRIFSGSGTFGRTLGTSKTSTYQDLKFSDVNRSGEIFMVDYNEAAPSRLLRINEDGVPGVVVDFSSTGDGEYLVAVTCDASSKLIVIESEYTTIEYSSSSSSSIDSSSSSSDSSESSSSSSDSSESSSSSSFDSSSSSSFDSSSSSSSSSSSISSESSSSSSSMVVEVLPPSGSVIVPTTETRPIHVSFTGEVGTTATVVLNPDNPTTPTQYLYTVGNVAGSFVWDIGGVNYIFGFVGDSYTQNAGGNLYKIVYDGLGSLLFTVALLDNPSSSSISSSSSSSISSESSSSSSSSISSESSSSSSSSSSSISSESSSSSSSSISSESSSGALGIGSMAIGSTFVV